MRRRLAPLATPLVTAAFALLVAGWAAGAPLLQGERTGAFAVTAQATGPLVSNDHEASAVLSAASMAPGQAATGVVTISNAGDEDGTFTLSAGAPVDANGPAGAGLSSVLDLVVSDVTGSAAVPVYAGRLGAFRSARLGVLAPGVVRRYRFAVTYPAGRPGAVDNAYQRATTSVAFAWDAVGVGSTGNPTPPPVTRPSGGTPPATTPTTPVTPAPGGGGQSGGGTTPPPARLTVGLRAQARRVAKGRLAVRIWSSAAVPGRVTGTVTVGRRKFRLRAQRVALTTRRRTFRLRIPPAAVTAAAGGRLTVRLKVTATATSGKATAARTLRVRSR